MANPAPSEDFVRELTSSQRRLHAFILSLLPDPAAAEDILQNTNIVIWRKSAEYTSGTNFLAWACQIAKHQVLSHIRDRGRDKHVFDEVLVEQLATRSTEGSEPVTGMMAHLASCLEECTEEQRQLIRERYEPGGSVKQMVARRKTTPNKMSIMLTRLRRRLLNCVRRKVAQEERS